MIAILCHISGKSIVNIEEQLNPTTNIETLSKNFLIIRYMEP
jgi:hypothetical protein